MTFRSVIPALLTPFQDDLSLAPERLAANARGLVERGIRDVVVCGTMGEAGALSDDERQTVIETAVASGARVTVGISSPDGPSAARRAEAAAALGAIGVMCLPPTTYVADERELDAHFAAVTSATDLPVMLYNNPEASRQDLSPETIVRLAERHERIVAVKECSGDARRIAHLVELAGDRLEVLVGGDDWALEGYAAGAVGWVSGVANVAAELCLELESLVADGDLDAGPGLPHAPAATRPARHDAKARPVLQGCARPHRQPRRPHAAAPPAAHRGRAGDGSRRGRRPGARGDPALMRASRVFHAVDSHTEGMPTRVITGGVGVLPGDTMLERKLRFERERDWIRTLLMHEPRGHGAMSGAILQPPCRDDADWGVVYIEVSGCLPMCGHGTIGVATVLVETGMVEVREPETVVRLDVPAGLVEARVQVEDGRAKSVSLRNVPSFLHATDGEAAGVRYDMAYGGNFYAIADAASAGLEVRPEQAEELVEAGLALMAAVEEPVHPEDPDIRGCRHVVWTAPGADGADSRSATAIHPGWVDRSPCGTGTSARMAQLWSRGELALGAPFVNEGIIGTRFTGRLLEETTVGGRPAAVPEITGRAWITGMGQYLLDPEDPFPHGFRVG